MTLLGIVRLGGFLIWLWKKYILDQKHVKLDDEVNDMDWRVWLVGICAIFLIIFVGMRIVAKYY